MSGGESATVELNAMDAARARVREHADLDAFISISDEHGDGRPLAVKDLIDVAGMVTTGGTVGREEGPAAADAPVVARLREAGYEVLGKTNLHEIGLGPTSGNPHYGAVRNPRDPSRMAGGSSGGSAAAVAAGICDLALGTDTGGSIRIPSSLCGTTGIRPTVGALDTTGVLTLAQTFDTVGPMARDVATVHAAFLAMAGRPPAELAPSPPGELRLATPRGWTGDLDAETAACWQLVAPLLTEVDLPEPQRFYDAGLTILYAEAAANHRRQLRERPETFGDDVRRLLEGGTEIAAVDYVGALRERLALRDELDAVLEDWDAIVLPTTATVAPPIGADPIAIREALTCFTRPFGVSGHPAISLPGPAAGLPVGIQVVARRDDDERLLAIAAGLERSWEVGE
ncbi:MAG TPA: amidase [Solirubrobacterales bacterium]|nr:amidase [Solirubrobacterales bacterium]